METESRNESDAPPAAAGEAAAPPPLLRQLRHLGDLIEAENDMLRARRFDGLIASAARKERALADLRRLLRQVAPTPPALVEIGALRGRLEINLVMLGACQSALGELAGAFTASAVASESDGTYRRGASGGWRAA